MIKLYQNIIFITVVALILAIMPFGITIIKAANVGDIVNFNVDKGFDVSGRNQMSASLIKISPKLYFYIDKVWFDKQSQTRQSDILSSLDVLSSEFDNNIYPNLTSVFGSERNPGIDNDSRITVLFEEINSNEGGYFREADGYEKIQMPDSNGKEMVYLSTTSIDSPSIKAVLAHEFVHLITFNQKNKIFGVEEDTWLNEARADYSSTILGYDDNYSGSNLQQRVKDFIDNPLDSITEWNSTKYDYASVSLFTHYLVDRYGISILSNSLKSKAVGIKSINQALLQQSAGTNFSQIFTNWTIALVINDCSRGQDYCYSDNNLNSIKINPTLIFLPLTGSSSLSSTNVTKNWAGNWQKIIGGSGDLNLAFSSLVGLDFKMPYILYDKDSSYSINFLEIGSDAKEETNIQDFGTKYKSLIIIPSLQSKISWFEDSDLIYPYSFTVSITGKDSDINQTLIQKLLAQIDSLKKQIADILAQRQSNTDGQNGVLPGSCSQINDNLYLGMANNNAIKCLQEVLKNQGSDIYPEGFITGNFGNLTKQAVIKFQEKYNIPATGFVGPLTRTKINQILIGG